MVYLTFSVMLNIRSKLSNSGYWDTDSDASIHSHRLLIHTLNPPVSSSQGRSVLVCYVCQTGQDNKTELSDHYLAPYRTELKTRKIHLRKHCESIHRGSLFSNSIPENHNHIDNFLRDSGGTFLLRSRLDDVLGILIREGKSFWFGLRGRVPSEENPCRSCSGDNAKERWVLGPEGSSLSSWESYCHVFDQLIKLSWFAKWLQNMCSSPRNSLSSPDKGVYLTVFRRRGMTHSSCHWLIRAQHPTLGLPLLDGVLARSIRI